jgi:predicted AAA+ superfamily ATPase
MAQRLSYSKIPPITHVKSRKRCPWQFRRSLLSAYQRHDAATHGWFWRTTQGDEVDLLVEMGRCLMPFEAKLHSAPTPDDVRGLRRCMTDLQLQRGYVLYPGKGRYSLGNGITVMSASAVLARPWEIPGI